MKTKQSTVCSRDEVLASVRATPNITAGEVAREVRLSTSRVLKILVDLTDEGLVDWKILPAEGGAWRSPRRGYFAGQRQEQKIPAAWDVLAHFFGRIAVPEAA